LVFEHLVKQLGVVVVDDGEVFGDMSVDFDHLLDENNAVLD
jgi:hypothetical protein